MSRTRNLGRGRWSTQSPVEVRLTSFTVAWRLLLSFCVCLNMKEQKTLPYYRHFLLFLPFIEFCKIRIQTSDHHHLIGCLHYVTARLHLISWHFHYTLKYYKCIYFILFIRLYTLVNCAIVKAQKLKWQKNILEDITSIYMSKMRLKNK